MLKLRSSLFILNLFFYSPWCIFASNPLELIILAIFFLKPHTKYLRMYANKLSYCGKFVVKQLEEKENLKKSKKMNNLRTHMG